MSDSELTEDELNYLRRGNGEDDQSSVRPITRTLPALAEVPARGAAEEAAAEEAAAEDAAATEAAATEAAAVPDAVRCVFEGYCRGLATSLGPLLRADVTVTLSALHQTSHERFAADLANPTCLQVMDAPTWGGKLLLELQPSIAFPLLDRLLGGGKLPPPVLRRALTAIEAKLIQRITREFSQQFSKAWPVGSGLELIPAQLLNQAGQLPGDAAEATVLVARLEIAWDDVRGQAQLGLPGSVVTQLAAGG